MKFLDAAEEFAASHVELMEALARHDRTDFVPLPALEPVEYPERAETYGERLLRLLLDGEISEETYFAEKSRMGRVEGTWRHG